ncbi:MAG: hypothetical protein KKG43_04070, partial [Candidatus Omnitrophica bacterium]|nr:hypothetical protein [Candidatus Omnitrophota bacterium]
YFLSQAAWVVKQKMPAGVYFLLGAAKTFAAQVPQSLPEWRIFFAWCRKDFCGARHHYLNSD